MPRHVKACVTIRYQASTAMILAPWPLAGFAIAILCQHVQQSLSTLRDLDRSIHYWYQGVGTGLYNSASYGSSSPLQGPVNPHVGGNQHVSACSPIRPDFSACCSCTGLDLSQNVVALILFSPQASHVNSSHLLKLLELVPTHQRVSTITLNDFLPSHARSPPPTTSSHTLPATHTHASRGTTLKTKSHFSSSTVANPFGNSDSGCEREGAGREGEAQLGPPTAVYRDLIIVRVRAPGGVVGGVVGHVLGGLARARARARHDAHGLQPCVQKCV